jgi:protein involved in polysaccharide export with SLBB domain
MTLRPLGLLLLGLLAAVAGLGAAEPAARPAAESTAGPAREPAGRYRLYPRDLIRIAVQGEPDVSVERRIDGHGEVSIPLLGQFKVAGLTVADAQAAIARRYMAEEIFIRPEVVVSVSDYSPKELMVLGQVTKQGKQVFPPETTAMPIVEAITAAGGFTRIAKGDAVKVTRKDDRGAEQSFTVNVERLIDGRGGPAEIFLLQPGDVVFVPERVF